jgi:uncharacterized protein with ATP-grasp and redox domains
LKIEPDCIDCIARSARELPLLLGADPEARELIVRRVAEELEGFDRARTPPEMGAMLCRVLRDVLGVADPFLEHKRRTNRLALELLPELRSAIERSADPFAAAVRMAIAGNVIDFGAPGGVTDGLKGETVRMAIAGNVIDFGAPGGVTDGLKGEIQGAVEQPLAGEGEAVLERLRRAVDSAVRILYLADNAGEIGVDRLLVEQLPSHAVTVVVRSGPALNDALLEDAVAVGLDEVAELMESGAAIPGTVLGECSARFVERFFAADVVISKGQGNLETLSAERGPIWYLLRAKCAVVARQLGCDAGDFVVAEGLEKS